MDPDQNQMAPHYEQSALISLYIVIQINLS